MDLKEMTNAPRLAQELALDQWRKQPPHTNNLEKLSLLNYLLR